MSGINSPEQAYEVIRPSLAKILNEYGLDDKLTLAQRTGYYSLMYENSVVMRIFTQKKPYISFPIALPEVSAKPFGKIKLTDLDEIHEYIRVAEQVLRGILERTAIEFGCCDKYMQCSDAKTCVHNDKKFALRCAYRRRLKEGKIFYGKNANNM